MKTQRREKQQATIYQELTEQEQQTRDYILRLPLFDSFKGDEIDVLARYMNHSMVQRGEYLFVEGDKGDYMCFIVSGLLEVLKKSTHGDYRAIARLGKGHTIGEMSIIDKAPRSATVIARQSSIIVILTYKAVDLLSNRHPLIMIALLKKIMRLLSLNMRRTSSWLADTMPI
ncbi:MAG: cyclic nucleotide-binding domain-containing protein [Desulfobulbaceae bacterium]|nr:cyclic nucleotide-binding domain-containing protein [Desulfobulbaceae bacterium]